ncbi:MAG: hypothetical protein GEU77_15635 [Deltaproteobacteria bacterium]|nr:hypothetical protein [Deltaproteobacteria bacterium]
MSKISGRYAIAGVGETKVGKRPDASTHSLHLDASRLASTTPVSTSLEEAAQVRAKTTNTDYDSRKGASGDRRNFS